MKTILPLLIATTLAAAEKGNWPQWRGPHGDGTAPGEKAPTTWSDQKNLKWKLQLPGAGASSPVIQDGHVYLTCYSGYGIGRADGDARNLMRHLICADAATGKLFWKKDLPPTAAEDRYGGMGVPEHGYATSTPATDGKAIYVFLGKSGIAAFDLKGAKLWQTSVGTDSSRKRWGSASSPVLYKNLVILNALQEGHAIIALDKKTGAKKWNWGPRQFGGYQDTYGTPALVKSTTGAQLIIAVPGEIWAFNADNGGIAWYAYTPMTGNLSPSVFAAAGAIYAFGGYPRQAGIALKAGGKNDITETHKLWTATRGPYVPSPVHHAGHIYWMDRSGYAVCLNAKTGQQVFRERLKSNGRNPQFYASPILVDGKIISVSRNAGAFVIEAQPKFKQLAQNTLASDRTVFNASPAISKGRLYFRSETHLYCIAAE